MEISKILEELDLKLIFLPIYGNGYFLKTPTGYRNLLVVSNFLSDDEAEKVILHELGHCIADQQTDTEYRRNYCSHLKSEHEANSFMVDRMLEKFAALGYDVDQANYIELAKYLGTDDFQHIKHELRLLRGEQDAEKKGQ